MGMSYFPDKLLDELRVVLPMIAGVNVAGIIDWGEGYHPTSGQLAQAAAVLAAHNPTDLVGQVRAAAYGRMAAVPNFATWTETQALAWHDSNIKTPLDAATTLAQAKAVMLKMEVEQRAFLRAILAMRDELWPNLSGG